MHRTSGHLRPPSLLTLKEASWLFGLSVNALKKHVLKGNLRGENLEGKVWLVKRKELERFVINNATTLRRRSDIKIQTRMPFPVTKTKKSWHKDGTLFTYR